MPTSLLAPLATAGVSLGAQALFGQSQGSATAPLTSFAPTGINAGGLSSNFNPGSGEIRVKANAARKAAVGNLANQFGLQAGQIGDLRSTVAPGFSDFRTAALGQVENSRLNSIGNLRENLQRRRVLGSSFGQDAVSRTEAEFAKQKADVAANSYLQELETTNQLMQEEFTARRGQFQTGLDEMNLEANIALSLAGKATEVLAGNAQMEARLNAMSQQNAGIFFGQTFRPVATAAGGAAGRVAGSMFGGSGGGGFGAISSGAIY